MNNRLREEYLKAIGIQSWQSNTTLDTERLEFTEESPEEQPFFVPQESTAEEVSLTDQNPSPVQIKQSDSQIHHSESEPQKSTTESTVSLISEYSEEQNISKPEPSPSKELLKNSKLISPLMTLLSPELINSIQSCKLCASRSKRLNTLVGEGNASASVFIISEPPSAEEDRNGHYLAGQAKTLFDSMYTSVGLIEDYFLTGIIKCHSLEQYLVSEEELSNCSAHLNTQIDQVKPSLLVAFGPAQAQMLLRSKQSFNELRGKVHSLVINNKEYPVIVSYHPAFLLRNPIYKREALRDLILIKNLIK